MEEEAVSNTTFLIYLSKLNIFNLAKNMFKNILVPAEVLNEFHAKNLPENIILVKELGGFLIEVVSDIDANISLDLGESAAISYCLKSKISTFLSDDRKARKIARNIGLNVKGILGVLLWNLENKKISRSECLNLFGRLINDGFYISVGLYNEVRDKMEE